MAGVIFRSSIALQSTHAGLIYADLFVALYMHTHVGSQDTAVCTASSLAGATLTMSSTHLLWPGHYMAGLHYF